MRKTVLLAIIFLTLLGSSSGIWAGGGKDKQSNPQWAGIYSGVIPAADCPGIAVVAILNAGGTYKITYQYIDRGAELFTYTGTFTWDEKTKIITLNSRDLPPYYKVKGDSLIQLDLEGKEITGKLKDFYKLRKVKTP